MLLVLFIAGCSDAGRNGSSQDEGDAAPTATRPSGTDGPDDPASTGNGSDDGNGPDGGIAWVPFGPDDPEDPTPTWPLYRAFAEGRCSGVQEAVDEAVSNVGEFEYGKAMVAVCRAAVEGSEGQWAIAQDILSTDPEPWGHPCLGPLVADVMERALAWHKQHPGQKPTVHFKRVDGQTECGKKATPPEPEETPSEEPTTEGPTTEEPSPTADDSPTPDETATTDETPESTG
jgi:hypothetical protein